MAIALNTASTESFVLKGDLDEQGQPKPDATTWQLGALTSYMDAHINSLGVRYDTSGIGAEDSSLSKEELSKKVRVDVDFHSMAIEAVSLCLKGWKNFRDHEGNDIEFKTTSRNIKGKSYKTVHSDIMERIPKDMILEMYEKIQDISNVSAETAKNLDTGS